MRPAAPFRLTRWFAFASLASIAVLAIVAAVLLSRFATQLLLHRTSEVTMEFVHSLIRIHEGARFFPAPAGAFRPPEGAPYAQPHADEALLAEIERVFGQIARMPDVIHANIYDTERRVVWSTNRDAIGRVFDFNPELAEALAGELAIESDILHAINYIKPEHFFLLAGGEHAVEFYIPVFNARRDVMGVVELYMSPRSLFEDVEKLTRMIWASAVAGSAFLFVVLLGIVRRADALIRSQQKRLVDSESLAAVGEMASAVAHGIRNPLSNIRSSAELIAEDDGPSRAQAGDIMRQVDRLEGWVRRLLAYAYQGGRAIEPVDVNRVIASALGGFDRDIERHRIEVRLELAERLPPIPAEPDSLEHVFANLVANAIDAMPDGGRLTITSAPADAGRAIEIVIADTGIGMSAERLARIFVPFHTTKTTGLGVGTPLVKRTVERLGGSIEVTSRPGAGATFRLHFPIGT